MKRITELRELDKVISGIIRELSLMYGVDDALILKILSDYSVMMSGYIERVIVVSKN